MKERVQIDEKQVSFKTIQKITSYSLYKMYVFFCTNTMKKMGTD